MEPNASHSESAELEQEGTMPDEPSSPDMGLHELQSRLRDLGYYDGPFEEQPWRDTIGALQRFQRDHDLEITGYPDTATARTLRESLCF
jgi:peptidoglycan hydrolase-like protein with peptidoglycan-binding domain